ncbi:MAG: hypothetical protein ABSD58_06035 [Verrucomicrobiia bacterium]
MKGLAISLATIVALAFVGYGFLWQPGRTLFSPHSDFVAEHAATKQVLYDSIRKGHGIPLWRSDEFSGYAGLINPQSQFTFPQQFLFFGEPPLVAVGGTFFLYFLTAGLVYYILARVLGLGFWPRLLMATAGMFSFKLIVGAYAGLLPNLSIVISFPLLFAAVFHLVKRPGLGSGLALAAAGGLCLHAGHLQLFYYSCWFLLVYLLLHAFRVLREKRAGSLWAVGLWLIPSVVLALGLAAYLLWPLAAEARFVSRSQSSYEFFVSDHAISLRRLATFFYPEALGTPFDHSYRHGGPGEDELWEDVAYFGLIPLLLAVAGTILGWRRWPTKYLAVCFVVTVFLSRDSFVLKMLYDHLPGFTLFRIPSRFLFLTTFFGIALAGIGLEETLDRFSVKYPRATFTRAACVSLIALMTLEGAVYARRYLKMVPYSESVPEPAYRHYLAKDTSLYRVAPVIRRTFNYAWAAPLGLQIVTGMDSFNYSQYQIYLDLLRWNQVTGTIAGSWFNLGPENIFQIHDGLQWIIRYDLLDALNVKYILSMVPLTFPERQYELVEKFENQPGWLFYHGLIKLDVFLYRNTHFLPRAFWARQIARADDSPTAISLVQSHDMRSVAVVEGSAPSVLSVPGPADTAEILQAWDGHLSVRTESRGGGYLVISEVWHPGWRALLDGRPLPLYRTDCALLGAAIPPGQHQLVMDFRPLHWQKALLITGISFTILVAGLIVLLARLTKRAFDRSRTVVIC